MRLAIVFDRSTCPPRFLALGYQRTRHDPTLASSRSARVVKRFFFLERGACGHAFFFERTILRVTVHREDILEYS